MSSPTRSQKTISSYFASQAGTLRPLQVQVETQPHAEKRSASSEFVDLTLDDSDEEAPIKKSKSLRAGSSANHVASSRVGAGNSVATKVTTAGTSSDISAGPSTLQKPSKSSVQKFCFSGVSALTDEVESENERRAKAERRELFKQKLLDDDSLFRKDHGQADNVDKEALHHDDDLENDSDDSSGSTGDNPSTLPQSIRAKAFSLNKGKQSVLRKRNISVESKNVSKEVGPSGKAYTPLEKQVIKLKRKYSDALLMFEVGYKYRFFGEDARIAGRVLNITSYPNRNFQTASIPVERRDIHLKNLLSHGYKVGIIGQLETAALKKISDNRNKTFERELIAMYTASTYIDDIDNIEDTRSITMPVLACFVEGLLGGLGADERVSISMVAITPTTGEVIWDEFEDGFVRSELETRLAHIRPSEILFHESSTSQTTKRILRQLEKETAGNKAASDKVQLRRCKTEMKYADALERIKAFYARRQLQRKSRSDSSGKLFAAASQLPQKVTIALAYCVDYLLEFDLTEIFTETEFFGKFTDRQHMLLNANTLANLEVYENQTDHSLNGSLLWILKKTKTAFGTRLLRSWIGKPLIDASALQARSDAVEALLSAESVSHRECQMRLRELLKNLRDVDLARGLGRIQFAKCKPKELAKLLKAFNKVANTYQEFQSPDEVGLASPLLNEIIYALPKIRDSVKNMLSNINLAKAEEDARADLWHDTTKYPDLDEIKFALSCIETEFSDELHNIRKILKKPAAQYITVGQDEYLIQLGKNERRDVPLTWERKSSTKLYVRYHTPEVKKKLQERAQYQERLEEVANKAYTSFLREIMDEHYVVLRNAVNKLAIADCLLSLAEVASQEGYVKPVFVGEDTLEIEGGRHPMIEVLRSDPFLPNSICIGGNDTRTKIITGPNMGGKSSTVRMIALIVLMAQIGSYVPASSVRLGTIDAILTRMGASDDLARGRSTFMVEMSETCDILRSATERSLVILDELGRGTSTYDGMAIAGATLEHLVENKNCKTLFITHYPVVALSTERKYPHRATNLHMGFREDTDILGIRNVTFLYKLEKGISSGSYGIECARLAGIPEELLQSAAKEANRMQISVQSRARFVGTKKACEIIRALMGNVTIGKEQLESLQNILQNLKVF